MKILVSGSSFVIENLLVVKGELMQLDQSFIGIIFLGDGSIIFLTKISVFHRRKQNRR